MKAIEILFQPTLPTRGATCRPALRFHPPRHFNPRSPHGERPDLRCGFIRHAISTHAPRTGSDDFRVDGFVGVTISTHAPRTGSDCVPL